MPIPSPERITRTYTIEPNLYNQFKDDGLEIIGFPCNQFGKKEPGSAEEIKSFCDNNYGVSFQLSEKVEFNVSNAHPFFKYLKSELKG